MFWKDKVVTYDPKDYESQFSQEQRNDINNLNASIAYNKSYSAKSLSSKTNYKKQNKIWWSNFLFSIIINYINLFLDKIIEKITIKLESREIQNKKLKQIFEDANILLKKIKDLSENAKLVILAILIFFLFSLWPLFTVFGIYWIVVYLWTQNKTNGKEKSKKDKEEGNNYNKSYFE